MLSATTVYLKKQMLGINTQEEKTFFIESGLKNKK